MKKAILFLLLIVITVSNVCSQSDKFWKLGYYTGLDFKTLPPQVIIDTTLVCMDDASTSIGDNRGNLLFYTNGFEVYNKVGAKMPNGKNFNAGFYSSSYYTSGCYPQLKSSIFLPFPNDTNKYYLLYENMQYSDGGNNFLPDKLRFLIIDKSLNGGLGDVIIKDSILVGNDTLEAGNILSFKHADGASYWLLARKYHSNKFYRILIDSFGIHKLPDQFLGSPYTDSFSVLEISNTSFDNEKAAYIYQTYHAINPMPPGQIDLYNFDRCSGFLSNYNKIILNYTTDTVFAVSVCFSPNNRFLYATDQYTLWQFDLQSQNIYTNKKVVGKRNNGETYIFWQMKNAIDGKIYISNGGGTKSLHVINAPDSLGLACNFVQKQIQIPTTGFYYANGGLPNEPNFALGKLNCDVGIETPKINANEISIFPNPTEGKLLVIGNWLLMNIKIQVFDLVGKLLFQQINNSTTQQIELDVSALNDGIYFIKITNEQGNITTRKFVKQ
jgi:hypothetical protein